MRAYLGGMKQYAINAPDTPSLQGLSSINNKSVRGRAILMEHDGIFARYLEDTMLECGHPLLVKAKPVTPPPPQRATKPPRMQLKAKPVASAPARALLLRALHPRHIDMNAEDSDDSDTDDYHSAAEDVGNHVRRRVLAAQRMRAATQRTRAKREQARLSEVAARRVAEANLAKREQARLNEVAARRVAAATLERQIAADERFAREVQRQVDANNTLFNDPDVEMVNLDEAEESDASTITIYGNDNVAGFESSGNDEVDVNEHNNAEVVGYYNDQARYRPSRRACSVITLKGKQCKRKPNLAYPNMYMCTKHFNDALE